ncbi:hypothetical protein HNR26_000409 [Rhizobium rosettiformans]|uniref:Uncharacterized protein n=1 Tax=Rhizobium rosettiformans TaxID=1368430 RepID=A0A7W8HN08_9HYPH|nr:hypothetical protein [Rhizobium rosettiformans]
MTIAEGLSFGCPLSRAPILGASSLFAAFLSRIHPSEVRL